jgi:hypothetical protein
MHQKFPIIHVYVVAKNSDWYAPHSVKRLKKPEKLNKWFPFESQKVKLWKGMLVIRL